MTIVPEAKMKATDLLVTQRLLEGYEIVDIEDIPLLATPIYAISVGESILSLDPPKG